MFAIGFVFLMILCLLGSGPQDRPDLMNAKELRAEITWLETKRKEEDFNSSDLQRLIWYQQHLRKIKDQ